MLDQNAFAHAALADDGRDFVAPDVQRGILQDDAPAEGLGQIADLD